MTEDDKWEDIANDAIALLNQWDSDLWVSSQGTESRRVMDPDLADLYRRKRALDKPELPYR
jgi:hypothetical protein